ncbi:MAG: LCP family protein [Actinomycetota bacterium]|nr:LCP family protein [Actinomycetota bacterium]
MYRRLAVLLVLAGFGAGCAPEVVETTTTTTAPVSTTTVAPTTTIAPIAIENAPPELVSMIEGFYAYATGESTVAPLAPEPVLAAITPAPAETPRTGVASVGVFKGQGVATVEMNGDLFLAIDDGSGWRIVGGNWPNVALPAYYGTSPRLVVVVGSDARPWEDIATSRVDSIHFVGLDGAGQGGIVGVPRDSWVTIAGGGRGKINGSLADHGAEGMMQTFRDLTGLPLEGYVLTGFLGFQEMLGNVLGGIDLVVPFPIHDAASGADFEPGVQYVNGPQALAFSRARKSLPNGDFTRSSNQGLVLLDAAKNLRTKGYGAIPRLMEMSESWMLTDLSPEQLLTFSALVIGSNLDTMPNVVTPGSTGTAGSASVVYLADSVSELWADLADGRLGS